MIWSLMAQAPAVPLVLNWREVMTISASVLIIFLSYALKESLSTKAHVHITKQEKPGSAIDNSSEAEPLS